MASISSVKQEARSSFEAEGGVDGNRIVGNVGKCQLVRKRIDKGITQVKCTTTLPVPQGAVFLETVPICCPFSRHSLQIQCFYSTFNTAAVSLVTSLAINKLLYALLKNYLMILFLY